MKDLQAGFEVDLLLYIHVFKVSKNGEVGVI